MEKLKVIDIKEYGEYLFENEKGEKLSLILEFYGVGNLEINDKLLINKKLLDRSSELFVQPYAFTRYDESDSRLIEEDIAGMIKGGKHIALKRVYG